MTKHLYRPMLRPVGSGTLPNDVRYSWEYVSKPASFTINRPDLPQSRYPYGEISLPRRLTLDEATQFDLTEVLEPFGNPVDQIHACASARTEFEVII
jgi:hypothetical protein